METKVLHLLVGAVAHDLNNLLTVVRGNSEILLQDSRLTAKAQQLVRETLKAEEQAALLCQELLAFSRNDALPDQILDLPTLLHGISDMLRRMLGESVRLRISVQAENCFVRMVPGQLERVLVNLALNARDAMPGGGVLEISVDKVEHASPLVTGRAKNGRRLRGATPAEKDHAGHSAEKRPSSYVLLLVSDTGIGMDDQVKDHLFEPFFTTKANRGLGLGLATVHTIVQRSGGFLEVHSEPGKGTSFKIHLPAVASQPRQS
jgi:signal transduction histidine kinase